MKYVLVSGGVISGIGKGISLALVIPLLSLSHCDSIMNFAPEDQVLLKSLEFLT